MSPIIVWNQEDFTTVIKLRWHFLWKKLRKFLQQRLACRNHGTSVWIFQAESHGKKGLIFSIHNRPNQPPFRSNYRSVISLTHKTIFISLVEQLMTHSTFLTPLNILRGNVIGLRTLNSSDHKWIFQLFHPAAWYVLKQWFPWVQLVDIISTTSQLLCGEQVLINYANTLRGNVH